MKLRWTLALGLIAGVILGGPAHAVPVLINGSFETGAAPPAMNSYRVLDSGNATNDDITGWVVYKEAIDWIGGNYWQPSNGSYSIELNGRPGAAARAGGIQQSFATDIGEMYWVEFDMSMNNNSPGLRSMIVNADGTSQTYNYSNVANTNTNMMWERRRFTFTATGATTTLRFTSASDAYGVFGPALDNVSIGVVPEPGTLAVFGLGGLALLRRRRGARKA